MTDTPQGQGESTWTRLRRRKVVQWGIAYAAGAWGFQQGIAYVSTLLDWPVRLQRLSALSLLVGLPVALTLAWYHGDKGEQRVTRTEFAILTLLLLMGSGLVWRFEHSAQYQRGPAGVSTDEARTPGAAENADARPSIAVLPFENRSDEHQDAYFADGIHDDILTQLSKIGALKVISRTSVERFRKTDLSTKQIAAALGVRTILEGGVQRAGDRVRINVQLIDAATDSHLWAEAYDRQLTAANIFAIQSEVAGAIATALKATLTPAEKLRVNRVPTQNLEAWESYQHGRQLLARRTADAFVEAEASFRRAIKADPGFALAYAGLADSLALSVGYSERHDHPLAQARAAADQALQIDPELPEAWVASAVIAQVRGEFAEAEGMYRRAIALDPNNAIAHRGAGVVLQGQRKLDESARELQKAAALDPLSAVIQVNLGDALTLQGKVAAASACFRRAIQIDPSYANAYGAYAGLLISTNRYADAMPLLEKSVELDPENPYRTLSLAYPYLDLGDERRFAEIVGDAARRWPDNPEVQMGVALAALLRGDEAATERQASLVLEENPAHGDALGVLRNIDLEHGRVDAALARYKAAYPELFGTGLEGRHDLDPDIALDTALVLQRHGDRDQARALLAIAERGIDGRPRVGHFGYGVRDAMIHAIRGENTKALAALREARKAGWTEDWRYYRDFEPALDSIRNEPEFKAVFVEIERDMARQRAELAARSVSAVSVSSPDRRSTDRKN